MKLFTHKSIVLLTLLTAFCSFGQGTGTIQNDTTLPIGIQNNHGVEDTRGSELTSVLILGAPGNPDWIDDVEAKLDGTGLVSADTFLTSAGTPTLGTLQGYDAVFVFTDAGVTDPSGFGDILAQYIDEGGAVVDATFTPNVEITGGFTAYELYSNSGQSTGTNLGIGTINDPGHPILNNVNTFDGGTSSFHNTGGTLAADATIIAEYTTTAPFIIIQDNVGPQSVRRTFLNFYPPSIDARDDFWDTASDGATIMANALLWTSDANLNDGPSILVVASPGNPDWINDVEEKLEETNFFNVNTFLSGNATPSLAQLQDYDAVFLFTDAGALDPTGLGNVLADYIDAGGPVVDATFTPNVEITGGFTAYELYSNSGQSTGANLGFGTILDPSDPILTNINTFDGGTSSFHNTGGTIAGGATVIAEYTDGSPLIIKDGNVGPSNARRVFLNFYPPSIDARDDFWDTASDGAQLMRNALLWAITGNVLGVNDVANSLEISIYPNPAQEELTISNTSGIVLEKMQIIDAVGRIVQIGTLEKNNVINISSLRRGIYFLKVESQNSASVIKFIKN